MPAASDTAAPPAGAPGSRAAFVAAVDGHVDAVHDHVVRWSRDARLAADATEASLASLLEVDGEPDRATLLRRAREHVLAALDAPHADGEGARLGEAVLGAVHTPGADRDRSADAAPLTPAAGAAAWQAASALDDREFSALDLAVRQRLAAPAVAAVLTVPEATARDLVRRATRTMAVDDGLEAYGSLLVLGAPSAVRSRLLAAADERFGAPRAGLRPGLVLSTAVLLLLAAGGVATALRVDTPTDTRPPAVVAAPVPEPTSAPTADPTLTPLEAATEAATPQPTDPPSPASSAAPTPDPTPVEVELVLAISAPSPGAALTAAAGGGVPTATVDVGATVTGTGDVDGATVVWTSDLDPDRALLTGARGVVTLWTPAPCGSATHPLRATATHPASATSATAVVDVVVTAACPLAVRVTAPTGPAVVEATGDGDRRTAVLDVSATADGEVGSWAWTSDQQTGVLLGAASGRLELTVTGCEPVQHLLTATATAPDGSTATDTVVVTVEPACTA